MNRNYSLKWMLVIFVVAWALFELSPPRDKNLLEVFKAEAQNTDTNFNAFVAQAEAVQKTNAPERAYASILEAIGTNDLQRYFPQFDVKAELDPNRAIINRVQKEALGKIRLGLDLRGGTSFLVGMDTTALTNEHSKSQALSQAVEVLRRRVDKLGVAEPVLQPAGDDRILVQLPGISEAQKDSARDLLKRAAFLEFRMVHPESDRLITEGITEPGYEVLKKINKHNGQQTIETYMVKKKAERGLTGKYLKNAMVIRNHISNQPEIDFELDNQGAQIFGELTREWSPKGDKFHHLAIVLDGELYSAPRIMGPIEGGRGQITGQFTLQEAWELANVLENPLQAPLKVLEERSVDPTLGKDSIRSGLWAGVIGTAAVALFMVLYYMIGGLVANLALFLNIIIVFGCICSIETTLTLPGIASIVLTIGMAVDANVLIFERIREELAAGKSLKGALAAGYDKAFGTILDSNITTLISSVILIYMGTGSVKGFGVILTIGLTASMFTSLVVTRLVFDWLLAKDMIKTLSMLHVIKGSKIDFMKIAKPAFIASWTLVLVGMAYGGYRHTHGSSLLGVDFAGGDTLTLRFDSKGRADEDKIRHALAEAKVGEAVVQYQTDLAGGAETLRITSAFETGAKVEETLKATFAAAQFERIGMDKVGPSIGGEIQKAAVISVLLSLLGIMVYVAFRYEFSFAVGAVISLIHDILMATACFFLWGGQMSGPFIAALLTIIGFSINDTIVIFDRIREDLKLGVRGTFYELVNQALNQTLSRTIITAGTVFLSTLALHLFGGGTIQDFSFTFLAGIITGTYSSIYIASAFVLWWHKGERPEIWTPKGATAMVAEPGPQA